MQKVRVGVIGCGLIAQVMHLPYLREMSDRFEIVALCDLSAERLPRSANPTASGAATYTGRTSWPRTSTRSSS